MPRIREGVDRYALRLVLFLYMIRCPHSLHRMGSLDLISFFAPQSTNSVSEQQCQEDQTHQHTGTPSPV